MSAETTQGPVTTADLVANFMARRRAYGEFRPVPGETELAWQVRMLDARTDYLVAVRELERHILLYGDFVTELHHFSVRDGKLRVTPFHQAPLGDWRAHAVA